MKEYAIKTVLLIALILLFVVAVSPNCIGASEVSKMKIRIKVGDAEIIATMLDNDTSRGFVALLPLTLTLKDYNGTKKVSDLPQKLSTKDAPSGHDPSVGDITYYAPWGNLAIFYKDFGYANGLVNIGHIESGVETLGHIQGDFTITVELTEAKNMEANHFLIAKQQSIIPIAAFTANGDMEKLKTALNQGLDAGLTVNEIKEILVQMLRTPGFRAA